jgi:hypothetical protein
MLEWRTPIDEITRRNYEIEEMGFKCSIKEYDMYPVRKARYLKIKYLPMMVNETCTLACEASESTESGRH